MGMSNTCLKMFDRAAIAKSTGTNQVYLRMYYHLASTYLEILIPNRFLLNVLKNGIYTRDNALTHQ